MSKITLRRVTTAMRDECIQLSVADGQTQWIANNVRSLEQADSDTGLTPFAIYEARARGWVKPNSPMIGFAMIELAASVGFIMRLMIGESWQGRGFGRMAVQELVRRLRLYPDVEMIASSYRRDNAVMEKLLTSEGFEHWETGFPDSGPGEIFVRLPNSPY